MSECMTQEDAMNMSNEQAVAILKPLMNMMRDQYGCPISDAYFAVGKAIEALSRPRLDEWCDDCAEYDKTTHSCPRFNRVIRETLDDVRKEAYKHGKSKGIKKGRAMEKAQTPCDVCRFNPPSSADGKPCTMCPAEPPKKYSPIFINGGRTTSV